MKNRGISHWLWIALLALGLMVYSLFSGSVPIAFSDVFFTEDPNNISRVIFFESRIPRTLASVLGGAALSVAGLLMQSLFRNPLAGPSVLGLSSGASLAVAVLMLGSFGFVLGGVELVLAAIIGSSAVLVLITVLSSKFRDITSVLIVGLMLSFFASAMISLLQSFASESAIKAFVFWGFGSFADLSLSRLWIFAIPLLLCFALVPFLSKPLNAVLLGETHARSMGVSIKKFRWSVILITGVLTGVVTAFCGPVAFIGLASPHIARFIFKTVDHRKLIPAAILVGGLLGLVCDIISRLPGSHHALPLNTVCAFMGAPVVLYLIVRGRKQNILL
ncbi:MAG: FecCD family ABC transporter permease [Cryomorphaceae bacterium]